MSAFDAPQSGASGSSVDLADLKQKSVRGGAITFVAQVIGALIGLLSTVVLARMLSPEDYGILAMVVAVTSFAGLFTDLGLSSASIQQHTLTAAQQNNLFWINVALGLSLTIGLAAGAPLVASYFQRPEVRWVTVALSTSFLINSLSTQSGVILVREMRFGREAIASLTRPVVTLTVSAALAFYGFHYWSLVWGQLAGAAVSTGVIVLLSSFRPGWPRRASGVGQMLKFGANVTAFDVVNYFHRNFDNVLIGRYWGATALGHYSRAYALLMFPITNLRAPITAVAFPALSRLRQQPEHYRNYYRRITALLALVSMPLSAFLFVVSDSLIEIALGPGWYDAGIIFSVLATVSFVQPVITLWGVVALSNGMSRRYLQVGTLNASCCVAGFLAGLPWGPVGVAAGYAIATYLTAYPILAWAFHGTPVRVRDCASVVIRPMAASVACAVICLLVSASLSGLGTSTRLLLHTAIFVPCYFLIFIVLPGGKHELQQVMKILPLLMPARAV